MLIELSVKEDHFKFASSIATALSNAENEYQELNERKSGNLGSGTVNLLLLVQKRQRRRIAVMDALLLEYPK